VLRVLVFGCLLVCGLVLRVLLFPGCSAWRAARAGFALLLLLLERAGAWPAEAPGLGFAGLRGKGFVELVQRSSLNRFSERFSLSQLSELC
jgi:hypothetical protein